MAGPPDDDRHERSDGASPIDGQSDDVESLLLECLEKDDVEEALRDVCARFPRHAAKLRAVWGRMRGYGLAPDEAAPPPATHIGPFEILAKLGEGGMGVVYRVRQHHPDREVAVKVVRPELLHFEGKRARFEREILATARLSHPNIVPILEVGEDNGAPWFSMEYVRGASLAQVLQRLRGTNPTSVDGATLLRVLLACMSETDRSAIDPSSAAALPIFSGTWVDAMLSITTQVAHAVEHAHDHEILHRDIKPSNIMITADGRALLVDFGLARADDRGDRQALTRSSSSLGSLPYMPRETLLGKVADVRVDVYGIGVTLFEALALKHPYLDSNAERTRARVIAGSPEPLRKQNPSVAWDVETVCVTAMAPEPSTRYPDVRSLRDDLDRLRARLPITARRPGAFLRLRRWQQRNPAVAVFLVTALSLLVVAGFVLYGIEHRARLHESELRARAERSLYISQIGQIVASVSDGNVRASRQALADADPLQRGWLWKHLDLRCNAHAQIWTICEPTDEYWLHTMRISPDDKTLVITSGAAKLRIAPVVLDGQSATVGEDFSEFDLASDADEIDISPDSAVAVASPRLGNWIEVYDLRTRRRLARFECPDGSGASTVLSDDASELFSLGADGRIVVRERTTGKVLRSWTAHAAHDLRNSYLVIDPKRRRLASCPGDRSVRIWDLTGKEIGRIEASVPMISAMLFAPDGETLFHAGIDIVNSQQRIERYRIDGTRLTSYGKDASVQRLTLHPNQPWLTVLSNNIDVFHADGGRHMRRLLGATEPVGAACFDQSGKLWTYSLDHKLRRWSLSEPEHRSTISGHRASVTSIASTQEGRILVSGDKAGRLLFVDTVERRRKFVDVCDARTVAVIEDGADVVAFFRDGTVARYDETGTTRRATWQLGTPVTTACRLGETWVTAHTDETALRIWRSDFDPSSTERVELGFAPIVLASRRGRLAAGAGRELTVLEPTRRQRKSLTLELESPVSAIAFNRDGTRLMAGCEDRDLRLFDAHTGVLVGRHVGHAARPSGIAFLPGDRIAVSASWGSELIFWDVERGRALGRLPFAGMMLCLAVSPDGRYIAGGAVDRHVHALWSERSR